MLMGIEHRWFELGIRLDVPISKLKVIEASYHDPTRCLVGLLESWLINDLAASWKKIAGVLQEMSERRLAHHICGKYVQGITASHEKLLFSWSTKSIPLSPDHMSPSQLCV